MGEIKKEELKKFQEKFNARPCNKVVQNGVMKNGIREASVNQTSIEKNSFFFSDDLDSEAVANQNKSGRCWMFAALNTFRYHIEKKLNLPKGVFELSQNYTNFWDKLEKSNYFYENMIALADRPLSDRTVNFLLQTPQQDGGEWDMLLAITEKYGVIPRNCMKETKSSFDSSELNTYLNKKLQQDAMILRNLVRSGASKNDIEKQREELLAEVYRILSIALGTPPETVDFEYRDKDKKYHIDRNLTPMEFYKKYVEINPDDYICLANVPTEDMPLNQLYGAEYSENVVGGRKNLFLNVDMDILKECAIKQLQGGEPLWFACDVLQSSDLNKGIMALDLYAVQDTFDIKFTMTKGERVDYLQSAPDHAMVLAGVDLENGKPIKWKVENSWGSKVGDKGYFVMSDEWMDQFTYQAVVKKSLLPKEVRDVLDTTPTILPPWAAL